MQDANEDEARNEDRLDALRRYEILDTPAERGFDDLTRIAAQLCGTTTALISLVDQDRQWFKARVGFARPQTGLDASICRHALTRTDLLEIRDLTLDPRTAANPLVTGEPHLRFYAGAPLSTPEGHVLGTLCVLDPAPRPDGLTADQKAGLMALGAQVTAQLDLRRALADRDEMMRRRDAEQRIALAEAARLEAMIATQQAVASAKADLGSVFQSITDGALRVVDAAEGAVIEIRSGDHLVYDTVSGASVRYKGLLVPLEATLSGKAVSSGRPLYCADTRTDPDMDHALARELGIGSLVVVPVTRRGEPIGALKVHSGRADAFSPRDIVMTQMLAGLVATAFGDVAEVRNRAALKDAEDRYRRTFESVTEFGIVVTDLDCTITEWNTGAERIFGWTAEEIIGRHANLFFTPEDRQAGRVKVEMRQALRDGQAVDERWHLRRNGTRFYASGNMMPLKDDDGRHLGFIKIVRDRTEQHLAGRRLERSEAQLRQAQVAGGVGLFTVDVADGMLTGTSEFSRLYGLEHRESRPAEDFERLVIDEDQRHVSRNSTRKAASSPKDVEYRIRRPDTGAIRWIARKGEFEHDASGEPVRFVGVAQDITDQVATRQALEDERELLAAMFEQAPTFMALLHGPEHRFERANPGYAELVGHRDVIGRTVAEALPEVVDQGFIAVLDEVYRTGVPFQAYNTRIELRAGPHQAATERFLDFVYQPIRNGAGQITGIFVEGADVTQRVEAQSRLTAAERRYRTLFNSIDDGFCIAEMIFEGDRAVDYRILEHNAAFERHTGLRGLEGRTVREMVPDLEEFWFETYGRVARSGEAVRFRKQAVPMEARWFEVYAFRLDDPSPNQVGILFSDVSERVAVENKRHILNRELSHRLKNTLAVVQSIAVQTLRTAPDTATARKTLTQRIAALSKAHDILLTGRSDVATIAEIIGAATALHDGEGHIELRGDNLPLGPKASLTLSLILHELSTNAMKYGALSAPSGRVRVQWSTTIDPETLRPDLVVEWRETGGPPVAPPTRRSFGTRLIEMGLSSSAESSAELLYAEGGLICRLRAPLAEMQSTDEVGT